MDRSWAEFVEANGKHVSRRIKEACAIIDFDNGTMNVTPPAPPQTKATKPSTHSAEVSDDKPAPGHDEYEYEGETENETEDETENETEEER